MEYLQNTPKAGKPELVPVITKVFNHILDTKKIPAAFKTGIITPMLKKGKVSKMLENYCYEPF